MVTRAVSILLVASCMGCSLRPSLPESYGIWAADGNKLMRLEPGERPNFGGEVDSIIVFQKMVGMFGPTDLSDLGFSRLGFVREEIELIYGALNEPPIDLQRERSAKWVELQERGVKVDAQPVKDNVEMIRFVPRVPLVPGGYVVNIMGESYRFAVGKSMQSAEASVQFELVYHTVKDKAGLSGDDWHAINIRNRNPFVSDSDKRFRGHAVFKSELLVAGTTRSLPPKEEIVEATTPTAPATPAIVAAEKGETIPDTDQKSPVAAPTPSTSLDEEPAPPESHALYGNNLFLRRCGPVAIGMTIEEAEKALGEPMELITIPEYPEECYLVRPVSLPSGLTVMIENKKVVRMEVTSPRIATGSGAKVGDSADHLEALYPQKLTKRSSVFMYDATGAFTDYVYTPTDAKDKDFRLIFLTENDTVFRIYVGILPSVQYGENCL